MELPKTVKLTTMPDGYVSKHYPLTLGNDYEVKGQMGSCVVISTDIPDQTASIHFSRVAVPNN